MGDKGGCGRAGQQEAGHACPGQDAAAASSHSYPLSCCGFVLRGVKEGGGRRKTLGQAREESFPTATTPVL